MRFVFVALIASLFGSAPALTDEFSSAYTKIDPDNDCTIIAKAAAGDGDWVSLVCNGYRGYPVHIGYSDLRESIHYGFLPGGDQAPRWESFAAFNSTSNTIEWRLRRSGDLTIPIATIHRWIVEGSETLKTEILVIEKVGQASGSKGCAVGYVVATGNDSANQQARKIADTQVSAFNCDSDKAVIQQGARPLPQIVVADR